MKKKLDFSKEESIPIISHFLKILKVSFPILLFILTLISWFISIRSEKFTDKVFTGGVFKFWSYLIGFPLSFLPFSLTEFSLFILTPIAIGFFIFFLVKAIKNNRFKKFIKRFAVFMLWVFSIAFSLYITMHGINFNRTPLSRLMALDTGTKTPDFLLDVTIDLAKKASAERALLKENENGVMVLEKGVNKTLSEAGAGYKNLESAYPFLKGAVNRGKPVLLSHPWSYTGITGMYFPMFNEANVNVDQSAKDIPSTAAHELAHTRGFAREDDANFLAYLTSINHPNADYRYSGYYLGYIYCSNALYDFDKDMSAQASQYLSEKVKTDSLASREYWKQFEGPVQDVSTEINNSFIEAHGDEDGVLSYNRVVSLILGFYEKEKMLDN